MFVNQSELMISCATSPNPPPTSQASQTGGWEGWPETPKPCVRNLWDLSFCALRSRLRPASVLQLGLEDSRGFTTNKLQKIVFGNRQGRNQIQAARKPRALDSGESNIWFMGESASFTVSRARLNSPYFSSLHREMEIRAANLE